MKSTMQLSMAMVTVGAATIIGNVQAEVTQWWENPTIKASINTGVADSADPHYLNKDKGDSFLIANMHSSNDTYPVQLYDIRQITQMNGSTSGVATAEALGTDLFGTGGNGWKGGAISDDLNIMLPGSGKESGALYTALIITNDSWTIGATGTWTMNQTAFKVNTPNTEGCDGLDFSTDSRYLYSNQYTKGYRNLIKKWGFDTLTSADGATLTLAQTFTSSNIARIRNISLYAVGGKDLVYYGEGEYSNGHKVCVLDTTTGTETVLVNESTFPASDILNVKLSGIGWGNIYMYVSFDNGQLYIYKMASNGLSVVSLVKSFTADQMHALAGIASGSKFRNFEVTNDGRFAFTLSSPSSDVQTDGSKHCYLNVVYTKPVGSQWWKNPTLKAAVSLGVTSDATHYINKSENDKYLIAQLAASNDGFPMQLYKLQDIFELANGGTFGGCTVASILPAALSWGSGGAGWKGGAVSEDLNVMFPGSGKGSGAIYTAFSTTNDAWVAGTTGTWNANVNAFEFLTTDNVSADSWDFGTRSKWLYSNLYSDRNKLVRWKFGSLTTTAVPTLTRDYTITSAYIARIRTINLYNIGGKDLIFYGEGAIANGADVCVFDTTTKTETLLTTDSAITGDIMNVKVSGIGSNQMYLYVQSDLGPIYIYKLNAGGTSLGEKVKTITANEAKALFGTTRSDYFRNLEVSNDGRYAVITFNAASTLRVLWSPATGTVIRLN